jgi:hypothetical protein
MSYLISSTLKCLAIQVQLASRKFPRRDAAAMAYQRLPLNKLPCGCLPTAPVETSMTEAFPNTTPKR